MIRGKSIPASTQTPTQINKTISVGMHNKFLVEVIDATTGEVKQKLQAFNTLCTNWWTTSSHLSYIHYGSGSGTPSPSDTSLFNFVAAASASYVSNALDEEAGVYSKSYKATLSETTAVGVTFTEIGFGSGTGGSTLCTHAMLTDMNGNPVSFTKTSTDIVNLYGTVYIHYNPQGYDNGSIRICTGVGTQSNNQSIKSYALSSLINLSSGIECLFTYSSNRISTASSVYSSDSKTITIKFERAAASSQNYAGGWPHIIAGYYYSSSWGNSYCSSFMMFPGGSWYSGSKVTKEAVGTGDGSTQDFGLSFSFPKDARVYIDGEETTEFTLSPASAATSVAYAYLLPISAKSTVDNVIYTGILFEQYLTTNKYYYHFRAPNDITYISLSSSSSKLEASNDLINWVTVSQGTIPSEYRQYKFWRGSSYLGSATCAQLKALHFNTPPAEGAVITADYTAMSIAKDSNHVFDLTLTIQLGEYTGDE